MNLISLEKAAKAYAHRKLLDGISLGVAAGDRIGVVGRNGAGKSTLLALLAGTVAPDEGRVARAADLRLGYLPQQDPPARPACPAGTAAGDEGRVARAAALRLGYLPQQDQLAGPVGQILFGGRSTD